MDTIRVLPVNVCSESPLKQAARLQAHQAPAADKRNPEENSRCRNDAIRHIRDGVAQHLQHDLHNAAVNGTLFKNVIGIARTEAIQWREYRRRPRSSEVLREVTELLSPVLIDFFGGGRGTILRPHPVSNGLRASTKPGKIELPPWI